MKVTKNIDYGNEANKSMKLSRGCQVVLPLRRSIDCGLGESDCAQLISMLYVSKMIERCNGYMMYSTRQTARVIGHPWGCELGRACAHTLWLNPKETVRKAQSLIK